MCHSCAAHQRRCSYRTQKLVRIVRARTGLARVYNGRDPENQEAEILESDRRQWFTGGSNSSEQAAGRARPGPQPRLVEATPNELLDRSLQLCAKLRLGARSFCGYERLPPRYVRPALGATALAKVSALDMQALYRELLGRGLSARSIRYTNWVLRSASSRPSVGISFAESRKSPSTMVASA